ncbi:hypothetical protein M9458_019419, partial [Cirrhinus mrigala]
MALDDRKEIALLDPGSPREDAAQPCAQSSLECEKPALSVSQQAAGSQDLTAAVILSNALIGEES